VWLLNGTISVCGDDVPAGFLTDEAQLLPPPAPLSTADLLAASLPAAWTEKVTTAHLIHASLSNKRGKPLPWAPVRQALDEAFRLGVLERTADSHDWPTDFGGAAGVKMVVRTEVKEPPDDVAEQLNRTLGGIKQGMTLAASYTTSTSTSRTERRTLRDRRG
jgi:hypothetical protein